MPVKGSRKPRVCNCGETNPENFYGPHASECKKCLIIRTAARQRGNKEHHCRRWLHRAYGWTPERYNTEFAKQHGLCALCGKPPDSTDLQPMLVIDHNQKTQKTRGLIHGRCNALLGYAREDTSLLLAAIDYLTRYR